MSDIYTTVFNHDLAMGTVFKTALIEIEDRLLTLDAFRARITALEIALREAREALNRDLNSNDLRAAEKHCDWQQFKHAWNAVWNSRKVSAITKIDEALK